MDSTVRFSGVVTPRSVKWPGRLAATAIYALGRTLAATIRYSWDNQTGLGDLPKPVIFCIWHNRLALCLELHRQLVRKPHPDKYMAAMVSASRDGGLLTRILEYYEVQPVRGSSSRRGTQALLEMASWAERDLYLAITPDGPRGPRYIVQSGVVSLARVTGLPIVPVSYYLSHKKCLKTWDALQIPLPFSRCDVTLGPALVVPPDLSDEQRENMRLQLNATMLRITRD